MQFWLVPESGIIQFEGTPRGGQKFKDDLSTGNFITYIFKNARITHFNGMNICIFHTLLRWIDYYYMDFGCWLHVRVSVNLI